MPILWPSQNARATGVLFPRPRFTSYTAPSGGGGSVTHGSQITASNTGFTAYYDSSLGRNLQSSDLTIYTTPQKASNLVDGSGVVYKKWFKDYLEVDIPCTIRGCRVDVSAFPDGSPYTPGLRTYEYVTFDNPDPINGQNIYGVSVGFGDLRLTRCFIRGHNDAVRDNGNVWLTECYVRVSPKDTSAHSDGIQSENQQSFTTSKVIRCNIDCRPTNLNLGQFPMTANAALYWDQTIQLFGNFEAIDNYLAGGAYPVRFGVITQGAGKGGAYTFTGNMVENGSFDGAPYLWDSQPSSSLAAWSNNRVVNPSTFSTVSVMNNPINGAASYP